MLTFYLTLIADETEQKLFEEIYYLYRKQMVTLAISVLENSEDAEDAVHDVFLAVASKHMATLINLKDEQSRKNYLLKATRNTALNICRNRRKHIHLDKELLPIKDSALSDSDFLDELCTRLTYEEAVRAIEKLDKKYADVMYMFFVLDLPVAEIASTLGRKPAAVRKQLERGKHMLAELTNGKDGFNGNNKS